jgi:3-deoxy-D-manno-octulosonic-acid transferase
LHLIYNIGIYLYTLGVRIAALFNKKAKLWVNGRKDIFNELSSWRKQHSTDDVIWMHCASLGEFEQGRPVLEALRQQYPHKKLVLTFFSPSGYEVRKNYAGADLICYLPADTPRNSKRFITILRPQAALIIKYEYWANYFFECSKQNVPLFIVSGILRKDQRFFGSMNGFWRKVLDGVTHFFVQNTETQQLLASIGYSNVTLAGDSRFDRVVDIAQQAKEFEDIRKFKSDSFCIIIGSSWPQEEQMMQSWMQENSDCKLILVPHEIHETHIASIQKLYPQSVRWTMREGVNLSQTRMLILDTIGMLSSIYRYGDVAMIGGGFGKGIHNTLEAAVWSIPVLYGPKIDKFEEAKQLVKIKGGFVFHSSEELNDLLNHFKQNRGECRAAGERAGQYVKSSTGATTLVLQHLSSYL